MPVTHGDIEDLENVVLKEDDYLSYSQNHILIETIIKSLLLDHTFLFVGYALNDYNLKLIMKWRDIIADNYKKNKEKSKSFIIDPTSHEKYEIDYLENNGVYVIDDIDITDDIVNQYSKDVKLNHFGKKVYSVLNVVKNSESVISDIIKDSNKIYQLDNLYNKLQVFKGREKIALCELDDVIGMHLLGEVLGTVLVIREYKTYKKIIELIENNNGKANYIREIFIKSGIFEIMECEGSKNYILFNDNYHSDMFDLLFQNNFKKIYDVVLEWPDSLEKAYYLYLCNPTDPKIEMILVKLNNNCLEESNIFVLMKYKLNLILCKHIKFNQYKNEIIEFRNMWSNTRETIKSRYKYLYKIFAYDLDAEEHRREFEELDNLYMRKKNTVHYVGGSLYNLYKLQRYSYEYYYYCKLNLIMMDHLSSMKKVFEPYIRGMLCTYTNKKDRLINNSIFDFHQGLVEYKLNKLDFEMLIKYIDNKSLKKYFEEYLIKKLTLSEEINLEDMFQSFYNLCESSLSIRNQYMVEYIKNYILILSRCELEQQHIKIIINGIVLLVNANLVYYDILDEIITFARSIKGIKVKSIIMLIDVLLNNDVINQIESRNNQLKLRTIFEHLVLDEYKNEFDSKVRLLIYNKQNMANRIIELNSLITEGLKKELKEVIVNNLDIINSYNLFRLLVDKYIVYDRSVENRFIYIIEENIKSKIDGIHTYPDMVDETLKFVVILHLLGITNELNSFKEYINYSIYIKFMLSPTNFDYSKINMQDYMWINLFNSKKYRKTLLKNGYDVIREKLLVAIEGMYATEQEKSIYYRYFNKTYFD